MVSDSDRMQRRRCRATTTDHGGGRLSCSKSNGKEGDGIRQKLNSAFTVRAAGILRDAGPGPTGAK